MPTDQIVKGADYMYTSTIPPGRKGHRYRVVDFVKHEPTRQEHVLMRCLSGPDKGVRFTVTMNNFAFRYEPAAPPFDKEAKPAGRVSQSIHG